MALTGKTNDEKIWNYLKSNGFNEFGTAGLMGNLYAESGLKPTNLQNSSEKKLGLTDDTYTAAVDNGDYQNFVKDGAGYGLAQWTYWSRKQNLLTFVRAKKTSIGDMETQLAFLVKELKQSYCSVYQILRTAGSVAEASNAVLLQFERPADQSTAVQKKRASYGQNYYEKFVGGTKSMSRKRSEIVAQAQSWIGCKEADGSHKKIIDLYNNHKPLARGYKVKYTDAWCATFASACAIAKGYTDIIPTECGCDKLIALFRSLGCWVENDAYVPSHGDYIFYDWQDSGVGDNKGSSDHVGVVEKVEGALITVIEGNYSNAVKRRSLAVSGKYIRGFGVPKYDKEASVKPATPAAPSAPATKKNYVLKNGSAKVGYATSRNNSLAGTYVTTSDLNMRTGAGTGNTVILTLLEGAEVKCYGYYSTKDGVKWYLVAIDKYAGFVHSKWLKKK